MINTDPKKIDEILSRGVGRVVVIDDLKKELLSGKKLRIKLGIDPTSQNLHIGRSVPLLKLRDFQELGHLIVFIVGDFTGLVGDTSDKESERPMISEEDLKSNMQSYFEQAGKIINIDQAETKYNSEWLGKLTYKDIGKQADQFSVAEFIARDNIKRRLDKGTRVSIREMLYPLMQGYDSVAIRADVELGGSDQWFNLLAGRTLQEANDQKPQNIITTELITGFDGRKMSSSWGNTINFTDEPNDMYGKVMSMHDDHMIEYFILCTRIGMDEVQTFKEQLESDSINPRDIKMRLADEIVTLYHGKDSAKAAAEQFAITFQERGVPEEIPITTIKQGTLLSDILLGATIVESKNEFRRLVDEGAITNIDTEEKITDPNIVIENQTSLKVGKKRFIKINVH